MSNAARCVRAGIALAILSVLGWLGGCSDTPGEPCLVQCPPEGIIVSDPILTPAAGLARGAGAAPALGGSAAVSVAYVSLPLNTVPAGRLATIHRVGDAGSMFTTVRDGGFDPVPVEANVGDSIEVVVADATGAPIRTLGLVVAARRPPIVVRTDPPRKKTDVPLNAAMVVVFSEPVAGGTLTASSVQVLRGTSAVAGTVRLLEGTGTIVAFTPAAPLEPNADYRLIVTEAVRDFGGDPLERGVTVEFTTGSSFLGPPASIMLSPSDSFAMSIGATYQLTATVRDAAGNQLIDQPVTWSTSDPQGLAVSATGLLTALARGGYDVTASVNGLSASVRVNVVVGPPASVEVTPTPATVRAAGDTIHLTATVRDATGHPLDDGSSVTWTSGAPLLATVVADSFGGAGQSFATVTGVSPGSVTITATSGTARGTASVTVAPPQPVASVTVTPASAALVPEGTVQLSATARDASGKILAGRTISWTTNNPAVAIVFANGLVTGMSPGSAAVTATSGGVSDTATITVTVISFTSVVAGTSHTCGLTTNGAAYCWGQNLFGELGHGSNTSSLVPMAVTGGLTFTALSSGVYLTCGLATSGAAYCWGYGYYGQLGDGSGASSLVPVPVSGGHIFASVSAGTHACGVTTGGTAYCWGFNNYGQLGNGSNTSTFVPVAVSGGLAFSTVSAGAVHTCGLTTAGAAYCWGFNDEGALGDGSMISSSVPVAVAGGLIFTAVGVGYQHTCGVIADGTAYCWGTRYAGGLGTGSFTSSSVPVAVAGGHTFTTINLTSAHTCGVTTSGAVYCWGENYDGRLGLGTTTGPDTCFNGTVGWHACSLSPVAVTGGLAFTGVSAGGSHTCGVTTAGAAYCWGANDFGQLGDGSTNKSSVPVKVAGQP